MKEEKIIKYVPIGESTEITLSRSIVTNLIAAPTRNGIRPGDKDLVAFLALCQARRLNPFIGDAFLIGFDTKAGAKFQIITAKSALDKRADLHPNFDGYESGITFSWDGMLEQRTGGIALPDERGSIVGAWCRVYRKDRKYPTYHDINRDAYEKTSDRSDNRWAADLSGMLIKCAEAGGLRKAFPNEFSGLYLEEEVEAEDRTSIAPATTTVSVSAKPAKRLSPESLKAAAGVEEAGFDDPEWEVRPEVSVKEEEDYQPE